MKDGERNKMSWLNELIFGIFHQVFEAQSVECDPTEWLWSIVSTEIWMRSNIMLQLWEDWAEAEWLVVFDVLFLFADP